MNYNSIYSLYIYIYIYNIYIAYKLFSAGGNKLLKYLGNFFRKCAISCESCPFSPKDYLHFSEPMILFNALKLL